MVVYSREKLQSNLKTWEEKNECGYQVFNDEVKEIAQGYETPAK